MNILKTKELYKIDLFLLKLLPMIMAFSYMVAQYAALFNIGSGPIFVLQVVTHYLGLLLAPMMFMLISSKVFQFCNYHRMFIYYILVIQLMNITNWYFKIPISNLAYNVTQDVITVGFLLTALIMYIKKRREIKLCKNAEPSD
jgi:hypothetical protein